MGRVMNYRLRTGAQQVLRDLDSLLDYEYGAPEADLGNKEDPLAEAIYIILSFQTDIARFKQVWRDLKIQYPTWSDVAEAPEDALADTLRVGGLHKQKSSTIKNLLEIVKRDSGSYSLEFLRKFDDEAAEEYLLKLPGLSWKGARCVLLYGLKRKSFPIDVNTFRILKRVGVIGPKAVYRRKGLHDKLQRVVKPDRRKSFHINLVIHGQRICVAGRPKCNMCVAREICKMQSVTGMSDQDAGRAKSDNDSRDLST